VVAGTLDEDDEAVFAVEAGETREQALDVGSDAEVAELPGVDADRRRGTGPARRLVGGAHRAAPRSTVPEGEGGSAASAAGGRFWLDRSTWQGRTSDNS
jgi:hypothetical protein